VSTSIKKGKARVQAGLLSKKAGFF